MIRLAFIGTNNLRTEGLAICGPAAGLKGGPAFRRICFREFVQGDATCCFEIGLLAWNHRAFLVGELTRIATLCSTNGSTTRTHTLRIFILGNVSLLACTTTLRTLTFRIFSQALGPPIGRNRFGAIAYNRKKK